MVNASGVAGAVESMLASTDLGTGLIALSAGIAIAGGAIAAAMSQSAIGAAGMGVIAEKPELAGRVLIYIVIPETILVFAFVVAYLILQLAAPGGH